MVSDFKCAEGITKRSLRSQESAGALNPNQISFPFLRWPPSAVDTVRQVRRMISRICPFCEQSFAPSLYHPRQLVCSNEPCQRKRRAAYHREKIVRDPAYRDTCRNSQKKWREAHPDYVKSYRKIRLERRGAEPDPATEASFSDVVQAVKNNSAIDLRRCAAEVWLICKDWPQAKNIVASAHVIVFTTRPPAPGRDT